MPRVYFLLGLVLWWRWRWDDDDDVDDDDDEDDDEDDDDDHHVILGTSNSFSKNIMSDDAGYDMMQDVRIHVVM